MTVVVVVGVLVVEDYPYRFSQTLTTSFDVGETFVVVVREWLLGTRTELPHPIALYLASIGLEFPH